MSNRNLKGLVSVHLQKKLIAIVAILLSMKMIRNSQRVIFAEVPAVLQYNHINQKAPMKKIVLHF